MSPRHAWIAVLAMSVTAQPRAAAQTIELRVAGPGDRPRILQAAIAAPHHIVAPAATRAALPRDTTFTSSVIVLGRDATIASRVHGDVIVIGGDLFLHPGAAIDGRAIAIGGGVYNSALARSGRQISFRDLTYDIAPTSSGYALTYRSLRSDASAPLTWPGLFGVGIPLYDRSDGLSLSVGPLLQLDTGSVEIGPGATYRSQIGKVDPSLTARANVGGATSVHASTGRFTQSNDAWIWSDLVNSASVLALGTDTRNYYRADRADVTVHTIWQSATLTIGPFVGGRIERAWSMGPDSASSVPWSFLGRNSVKHMRRPNPPVTPGTISSALGGARLGWDSQGVHATLDAFEEVALHTPITSRFAQTTLDGTIAFPTFGTQRYRLDAHVVLTGGTAPPQRWAYLGGAGTMPLLHLLEQGGDQLVFLDSRYDVPLDRVTLPLAGSPTVTLRHLLGAAGVDALPALEQRVGVRLSISVGRVELIVDPATRRTHIGVGISFAR